MNKRTTVSILILMSIILINVEHANLWINIGTAALAGLLMSIAVGMIFSEIERRK